jgi:hypothetical protein
MFTFFVIGLQDADFAMGDGQRAGAVAPAGTKMGNSNMACKGKRTDDRDADRNQGSNPGPRQEGLGGGFWSEEMVSTDWPLMPHAEAT